MLLAALLGAAAPAGAATVAISGSTLQVTAAGGETNNLTLSLSGGTLTVAEAGDAPLTAGAGCSLASPGQVACGATGISALSVDAGDLADRITQTTSLTATLRDGTGDDVVTGGAGADTMPGGAGDDTFEGGAGDDTLSDGGGLGADVLAGGPGNDRVSYLTRAFAVTAGIGGAAADGTLGEGDDIGEDVETLEGGNGPDTLTGGPAANTLRGSGGADVLDGGPGADVLGGGSGADLVTYGARASAVTADLDGVADDGEAGEGDRIETDVNNITGGTGADVLTGSNSANELLGGPGADALGGRSGDDRLDAGAGNDTMLGEDGRDRLLGAEGTDTLDGGLMDDALDGGLGADTLTGGTGTDTADYSARLTSVTVSLDGQAGDGAPAENDAVGLDVEHATGGAAPDRLTGGSGANTLTGGLGADALAGAGGDDTLRGGDGDDGLEGEAGRDSLDGGTGADRLRGGTEADSFTGGDGADTADYADRSAVIAVDLDNAADDGASGEADNVRSDIENTAGGVGADRLTGDGDPNALSGGPGDDTIDGGAGDDRIEGGPGRDTLRGGDQADRLDGGDGPDALNGGAHADALAGGAGDDTLEGAGEADVLAGGPDRDSADYSARRGTVLLSQDAVANDGEKNEGDDLGADIERLVGGPAGDRLAGGAADNALEGRGGDDSLISGAGDDTLSGGDGYDTLEGGDGADALNGGAGTDVADYSMRTAGIAIDLDGVGDDGEPGEADDVGADVEDLRGGSGDDRLAGAGGPNKLTGGQGDDVMDGGLGPDVVTGGAGTDMADYGPRTTPVAADVHGDADDGEEGENDAVAADVEGLRGGQAGDELIGSPAANRLIGGGGDDQVDGRGGADDIAGEAGGDTLVGGLGADRLDGGAGNDRIGARDGGRDRAGCGGGRDTVDADKADTRTGCERRGTVRLGRPSSGSLERDGGANTLPRTSVGGVKKLTGGGRFVAIPGFPGERIDRRLLRDIAYLRAKYKVHITDGYARAGHAPGGEHPIGLAIDVVPGPGGTWDDIDRLARWAEPRQNRPRLPFRFVGYDGDANHGRGHHLHLSWAHSTTRPGRPASWVYTLALKGATGAPKPPDLRRLARVSNTRLGRAPRASTGLRPVARCSGPGPLRPTWQAAGRSFGISWKVLAGITSIESNFGCNMGPSSAGALGWTQFMPGTWKMWGMDADGDGRASPYSSADAIYSSARYLRASGAPGNYRRALYAYNRAWWYVNDVLRRAKGF